MRSFALLLFCLFGVSFSCTRAYENTHQKRKKETRDFGSLDSFWLAGHEGKWICHVHTSVYAFVRLFCGCKICSSLSLTHGIFWFSGVLVSLVRVFFSLPGLGSFSRGGFETLGEWRMGFPRYRIGRSVGSGWVCGWDGILLGASMVFLETFRHNRQMGMGWIGNGIGKGMKSGRAFSCSPCCSVVCLGPLLLLLLLRFRFLCMLVQGKMTI